MPELERIVCTYCGATMQIESGSKSAKCKYCNSEYHFKEEKGPALILALNNAAGYLTRHDFDSAIVHYESVLKEYPNDSEAAWGHAISTYGIVYEKDDRTEQMIPTCSRIVKESILHNSSYLSAIRNCAEKQRAIYEENAAFIDRVQKKIKRAMEDEEDFDVFISFKAKDENGIVTEDSVIARNIYDELKKRGIKPFFSEVTLKNRFGDEFEPIIYRALYSCKFFILVSTKEEYIEAPWVKNEWTRFRDRVMDEGLSGACAAVYKNISAYALPRLFQSQGIELEKHPFDYAQLIADNLSVKLGLNSREKELEEKQRKMEVELQKLRLESEKIKVEVANRQDIIVPEQKPEKISTDDMAVQNGVLIKYNGNSPDVIIPKGITVIGENAFKDCANLVSVKIPDGVTNIGKYAFLSCANLKSITLPDSVTSIGEGVFWSCESLASITIPDTVTSIGKYVFNRCASLTSIVIPDSVTSIGCGAFYRCTSLESITLPFVGASRDGIENTHLGYIFGAPSYSKNAEYVPSSLKNVVISSAAYIDENTFKDCSSLMSITVRGGNGKYKSIDGNLYTIDGKTLIQYAIGKTNTSFAIPNGVMSIGCCAFKGCTSLTSVVIPDSMTTIGDSAFYQCTSLTDIVVPCGVRSIGKYAFSDCTSLKSIVLPDSMTSIGDSVLRGCVSLESITLPFVGETRALSLSPHFGHIFGCAYAYDFAKYISSSLKTVVITSAESIYNSAFKGCAGLTKVIIPASVTSVYADAFADCRNLKIFVDNAEQMRNWDKKWNPDNCKVFDKNGREIKKNIFGVYK